MCSDFNSEVSTLEKEVIALWGAVVTLAKKEDDLKKISELWGLMVKACDSFLKRISDLMEEHPACFASHDKILELRSKAMRMQALHC